MEPFWPVFCCVLAVLIVLLWKSRRPGMKEHYREKMYPRSGAESLSLSPDIPLLSAYDAALLIRDTHRLVLMVAASLIHKGVLVLKDRESLVFEKKEYSHGDLLEEEEGFLSVLGEGGRIAPDRLHAFFHMLADRLAKKIWLSDKVLLRHFLEDKVELCAEMASALTFPDTLWLILHEPLCEWRSPGPHAASASEDRRLLPALVYQELALSYLFSPDDLEYSIPAAGSIRQSAPGRHEPFPPAAESLQRLYAHSTAHYRCSVVIPCRHALAQLHESMTSSPPDGETAQGLLATETARQHSLREEAIRSLTIVISEKERALTAQEDRVDYLDGAAESNPVLAGREESVKLRRDILSREVFQLRVSREKLSSPARRVLNWKQRLALARKVRDGEKALESLTGELDALRKEWERERREKLRDDPAVLKQWSSRLLELSGIRMEKASMEWGIDFLAREAALLHACRNGSVPPSFQEAARAVEPFLEMIDGHCRLVRAFGALQERIMNLERAGGAEQAHVLQEFCELMESPAGAGEDTVMQRLAQGHEMLDLLERGKGDS